MQSNLHKSILYIDPHRGMRHYDQTVFGQFLEHFHRQVYGGIFEPGSPLADERGFRQDLIDALCEFQIPIIQWPGGYFAGE